MALGPLLSLPLAYLPERQVAGLTLNSVTAVGWVMALAWLAFICATLMWFQEPPKMWAVHALSLNETWLYPRPLLRVLRAQL